MQSLLKEKCEILCDVDRAHEFAFVCRERWGLRWKMCMITKPLLSPDSLQLPMLSCTCTVNVFCYCFSSPTLSLLCLFLSFCAFFMKQSISHYFSLSSHRGFCNLLPWLTWAGKWALQYFMTLTWRREQTQLTPNCTFNPRANLSQINFFFFLQPLPFY